MSGETKNETKTETQESLCTSKPSVREVRWPFRCHMHRRKRSHGRAHLDRRRRTGAVRCQTAAIVTHFLSVWHRNAYIRVVNDSNGEGARDNGECSTPLTAETWGGGRRSTVSQLNVALSLLTAPFIASLHVHAARSENNPVCAKPASAPVLRFWTDKRTPILDSESKEILRHGNGGRSFSLQCPTPSLRAHHSRRRTHPNGMTSA